MTDKPRVYVLTYERYGNGSLEGQWVDLDNFNSANDFIKHCFEIFIDEQEPELMFGDWENVPEFLTDEEMSEEELERLFEFLSLDESEKSVIVAYVDATGDWEVDFRDVFDSYMGSADSEADFAEEYVRECYSEVIEKLPDFIVIDWEGVWEQNLRHEFYVGEDDCGEKHFFHM